MRVYEIAKLLNISNKDLIDILSKEGFEVKSHMSALPQEALDFIDKKFKKDEEIPVKKVEPQQAPVQKKSEKKDMHQKIQEKIIIPPTPKQEIAPKESETIAVQEPFIVESMTIGQLAEKLNKPASDLILNLLKQGIVCPKNQMLAHEVIQKILGLYEIPFIYQNAVKKAEEKRFGGLAQGEESRLPVVVVLGHVDHGKTTLLDFIRKTRVAQKEKGGITQHLGAYRAETPQGDVVFIDTPGHEAFSNIRGRGVRVADLAVLVIAADDSIKPQTIEAIQKIKKAEIPVIIAANKMDKVDKNRLEVLRADLARYDLLPEEWGGEVIVVPISAKVGTGVDKLLEMIVLQSQMMDLKTSTKEHASGFILESKLQKGLGAVATVICQKGTLKIGDLFSAGQTYGKVSSLIDSYGTRIKEVGPSVPVQVAGFNEMPHAGDSFEVVAPEKFKALKSSHMHTSLEMKKALREDTLNIIVKVDSTSSKEALLESIEKISAKHKDKIYIVFSGVGAISESDVVLAANTGSIIIGLHVKVEPNAVVVAQKNMVSIKLFDIIYKLLEDLEVMLKEEEPVKMISRKSGEAVVRKVFAIKNLGTIAGSYCKEGVFSNKGRVVIWRGKEKIGEGPIKSLERDRKSVKDVHAGFEFAFLVDGFNDWQIDDRVECFVETKAENNQ
ncbi:MAG: translation initiation factor IF-2 [Candidatus Babeliales bacterium]